MLDRRQVVAGGLAAAAVAALPRAVVAQAVSAESARARALYDRLFEERLRVHPEEATSLGLDTGERGGLRERLTDQSAANRFGWASNLVAAGPEIRAIDPRALPPQERPHLEILRWHLDRREELVRDDYGLFFSPYTLSQLEGSYRSTPLFLDSQHPVATASDAEAWLSRLEAFARNIGHEVDRSRSDAAQGVIPPSFILDKALTQTRALRAQSGHTADVAVGLQRKASAVGLGAGWDERAGRIVDGPIAAAVDRQLALLTDLRMRSTEAIGVSRLPNGARYYAARLRYHTSTDLTPSEAHRIGLREVADYERRLDALLRAEGLTTGGVGARLTALGQRPDQLFPNTDAGRDAILAYANARTDAARPLLPRYFNDPPAVPLEIRRVPPAMEVGAPRGFAQRGPLDGSRPSAFYINLRDTMTWPRFSLPTLVFHEGIPGQVFEGAMGRSTQSIPMLHRISLRVTAWGEGWGLYAEQLADEMGLYENEPLARIGYLQAAQYRAVRVVVDTGMHALGWSRPRALAYMIEKTGLPLGAVENEIDRYIVLPGQATSYKIGHTEIVRAREAARRRMGARFDLKDFHDVVLRQGPQPLDLLRRNVDAWSAAA